MAEGPWLSNRHFRSLTDDDLAAGYVPGGRYGSGVNCGRAWREIKRRAAVRESATVQIPTR